MRQSKEEDLARWRGLVSEQVASGKSVASFCRNRGLRVWQLYEWKKRLGPSEARLLSLLKWHPQKQDRRSLRLCQGSRYVIAEVGVWLWNLASMRVTCAVC